MRALLPFIRLFKFAKWPLFLGGLLMILGLASSIGLLTLSGWFLAATAIAGFGTLFNFFYLKLYWFFPEHPEICYQSKRYPPDYILLPELFTKSPFGINKESCPDKSKTCNKCIS